MAESASVWLARAILRRPAPACNKSREINTNRCARLFTSAPLCAYKQPRGMDRGMDMARSLGMLSAVKVNSLKARGFYCDGGGLYLQVSQSGSKSWVFRFKEAGRTRDMGLGPIHTIGLKEARELATEKRKLRLQGIDPIKARDGEREARRLEQAKSITFDECCARYIETNQDGWKNRKHRQQWTNTLATYVSPVLGAISAQAIDTTLVLQAIEPIWKAKPETASRVRGRIETVLDWAKARGYRTGENPARWTGHLENVLPGRSKVKAVEHLAALPWPEIGTFMVDLGARNGMAAAALEFTILTAARTKESLGAQWSEVDFAAKVWTCPPERMKEGREHRVPLSTKAMSILQELRGVSQGEFIFANSKGGPLSDMAMLMLLRRMGRDDITVHGFRSTFRDWAFERSNFQREIVEAALAHAVGDKAEAAYKRGDAIEKRRRLMEAWSAFCARAQSSTVVSIGLTRA
jgi:integrase